MNVEVIREYNRCVLRFDREGKTAALAQLGMPSPDELVARAMEGLDDPDRNVRFQMLRLAAAQSVPEAGDVILRALHDPARRVRKLAVGLAIPFAGRADVEARLRVLTGDEDETPKIRASAFGALSSGVFLSRLADSPVEARHFLEDVPGMERYRQIALQVLVSLDPLDPDAEALLRHVVEAGTKDEAVAATRALCGQKVVNLGAIRDPLERRRVSQGGEPAWGRVWYWVPRAS